MRHFLPNLMIFISGFIACFAVISLPMLMGPDYKAINRNNNKIIANYGKQIELYGTMVTALKKGLKEECGVVVD